MRTEIETTERRRTVKTPLGRIATLKSALVVTHSRSANDGGTLVRYTEACLHLLPEELLQFVFAFITAPPLPDSWLSQPQK